ncbi:MAG: hypothetical protein NXY57DRAFT_1044338 [Lentinula lateritia]|nr:MAG: hypothetical protein NXY57DRAFT_1044338 [Lentinula lateritia]
MSAESSVIISPSRSRCDQWNSNLPKVIAKYLRKTLSISNAEDIIYFAAGSSLHMQDIDEWKDHISNAGSILGTIPMFIGMRCSIAIDSMPIWGVIHDIVLDPREHLPAFRPDVVELRFPLKEVTVFLAPEVIRWNANLGKVLHIKPVVQQFDLPPSFPSRIQGEITRTQIPVAPLFAAMEHKVTEHEVTGQHFPSILIDMRNGLKAFLSVYGVLSRVEPGGRCWITETVQFEDYDVYSPLVKATLQQMSCT